MYRTKEKESKEVNNSRARSRLMAEESEMEEVKQADKAFFLAGEAEQLEKATGGPPRWAHAERQGQRPAKEKEKEKETETEMASE